jgi:hypothetical protein
MTPSNRYKRGIMAFNICPDDGPPRLWRFVDPGVLPPEVVATLDKKQNLLTIDRELYDKLPWLEQHIVLRTHLAETHIFHTL